MSLRSAILLRNFNPARKAVGRCHLIEISVLRFQIQPIHQAVFNSIAKGQFYHPLLPSSNLASLVQ